MRLKERLFNEYKVAYKKWFALDQEEKSKPGLGREIVIMHEKNEANAVMAAIERCLGSIGKGALRDVVSMVQDEYWSAVSEEEGEE